LYVEFVVGHGQWAFADDDRQKDKTREEKTEKLEL
jgi:hypothetical protein